MSLRVLITNIELYSRSGTTLYVRDLALELRKQGHTPVVYTASAGEIAQELRAAGISVATRLRQISGVPDIIHGHHYLPTLDALRHFRSVPAIFICHDHVSPWDRAPLHPGIRRYFGVSKVCVARLLGESVPAEQSELLLNFVDTDRFRPRAPLPDIPRKALVFSNYAHAGTHLPAVREACLECGLDLNVVGFGIGKTVSEPEALLPQYDIVFAKAKAAIEAMAVGCAVVLCDFAGVGPLVTPENMDGLRPLNFGFEAMRQPLGADNLISEIRRYDPCKARQVRDAVRSEASLTDATSRLVHVYRECIALAAGAQAGDESLPAMGSGFARQDIARSSTLLVPAAGSGKESSKSISAHLAAHRGSEMVSVPAVSFGPGPFEPGPFDPGPLQRTRLGKGAFPIH